MPHLKQILKWGMCSKINADTKWHFTIVHIIYIRRRYEKDMVKR